MPRLLDHPAADRPLLSLLESQLEEVALVIERQLASDLPAVNALCRHVERYRGKMLRPTMVLLSGLASVGAEDAAALTPAHRTVAAVTELIHMATLVHDDVLDDAAERRRGATVNALHGNEMAVMLGDYLISNAFHLCSSVGDPAINLALGRVTNTLCEGELLQLHHRNHYGIDEATYFEIVKRKTASLIAEACRLGAMLCGAPPHVAEALAEAGTALGIAFQIQDDLLDLVGDQQVVGKSLGRDLDKGKLTLPLILHLGEASPVERGEALRSIEQRDHQSLTGLLLAGGAIARATDRANEFVSRAKRRLAALPAGPARDLFDSLADRLVMRPF
ncbi:MAG: polyprenyl synthetase family protein [Phycisphaeraceae bacterium]|nr:polyprenyl synthetase family protein [Phycisphaerales bacterium]QOJ17588.1 MAG: polyprenyl synthetase family protein [Phycisphaeraceae bacterium]